MIPDRIERNRLEAQTDHWGETKTSRSRVRFELIRVNAALKRDKPGVWGARWANEVLRLVVSWEKEAEILIGLLRVHKCNMMMMYYRSDQQFIIMTRREAP